MSLTNRYIFRSRETFEALQTWFDELEAYAAPDIVRVVIGNKSDKTNRAISEEEARAFADAKDATYLETSAMQQSRVQRMFDTLIDQVIYSIFNARRILSVC